jgi:hypothetical protein
MECVMNIIQGCALNYYPNMYVVQIIVVIQRRVHISLIWCAYNHSAI